MSAAVPSAGVHRPLPRRRTPWYLPRDIRFRRHLRFTREGKLFVFVTLGLGFAAVNTGTNLMYLVFGFMLSLIVLSGVLSEHVLRGLAVERRLPARAVAGEPALIELCVKNGKRRLVSYSVEVEDQAEGVSNLRRCYFLKIGPGGEQSASYRRVPEQRGLLRFTGFSIATRFPFALFEKWREVEQPGELLVFPRPLATPLPEWTEWAALIAGSYAFAGLFQAARRDYPLAMASSWLGYLCARFGGMLNGPEFGVFLSGLVVSASANLYARLGNRPGAIVRVPGIIMLVPGSVGFRSLFHVFEHDVYLGLDKAVSLIVILGALAAGLLFGNLLLPPRRSI